MACPSANREKRIYQAIVSRGFLDLSLLQPDQTLMSTTSVLRCAANKVYERAFPIYRPFYAAYKTYADRAERVLLRKILFQGAVVADVGANIGIYSQFLSRCVGPTGSVHSFEPSPDNFGGCLPPHVIFQTCGLLRLRLESGAASANFMFQTS